MTLRAVECRGYKGFRQPTRLPLHKITVLFGKNNSGKTTLARLPIFAAASISNSNEMYALAHDHLAFGSSFTDLASVEQPHPQISFGIEWSTGSRISLDLQHVASQGQEATVQPVQVELDRDVEIQFPLRSPQSESVYAQLVKAMSKEQRARFLNRIEDAGALLPAILHIPSTRPRIETTYTTRPAAERAVDEVPYLLASQRGLLADVDRWFRDAFDETSVGVDQAAFAFQLSESRSRFSVNLSASGRGLQAVIPIVTLLMDIAKGTQPTQLVILEEPEAHLHPSLHSVVADLVITCSNHCQVVVETHSENFILRLRRRIAEQQISQGDLGLYYLDEDRNVNKIIIDESGATDNWPAGIFESDIDEARAIVEAKLRVMRQLGDEK